MGLDRLRGDISSLFARLPAFFPDLFACPVGEQARIRSEFLWFSAEHKGRPIADLFHAVAQLLASPGAQVILGLPGRRIQNAHHVWDSRTRIQWQEGEIWVVSREELTRMKSLRGNPVDLEDIKILRGEET